MTRFSYKTLRRHKQASSRSFANEEQPRAVALVQWDVIMPESRVGGVAPGPPNKRLELSSAKHRKRARRARKVTCHSPKTGFKTADVICPKTPEKGPRPARLHATSPKTGPGAVWGELIRKRAI